MKFWIFLGIMKVSCINSINVPQNNVNIDGTACKKIEYCSTILEKSWKTQTKNKVKFVITNYKGQKIIGGFLQWNFANNEWNFYYDETKVKITIKDNQIISQKHNSNKKKVNACSGFAKILSKPIEKWNEIIPFDNEIKMKDNTCYTEFKTNKSYLIIYFQIKPFKLINMTFSENGENYIFSFEEC